MSQGKALGATPEAGGTTFRVWSTSSARVSVRLFDASGRPRGTTDLRRSGGGAFEVHDPSIGPGALYKFVLDGDEVPDPYARFLPLGVHGPAEVMARGRVSPLEPAVPLSSLCTYELHVGTFTPAGTYAAATERLADVADLGVTAIELMPIAAFAGERGWGYDGVAHYAPHAAYGRPEDLRRFVEAAHDHGLAVLLDAVYNHFGPSGNYLGRYAPEYFKSEMQTPWGAALDFTQPRMREYVLGSARMWLDEYGFDGLRLDATHAMIDPSPRHILAELGEITRSRVPARLLIAEDDRNDPALVAQTGIDAVWADDFHHQVRTVLTGESDGYYAAYPRSLASLARVIERGWSYEGQSYEPWGRARGKPADALFAEQFVYCIDNHDQAGNRAFGQRLSQDVTLDAFVVASAVLLFLPMSPLLFMGQEWGASTPFLYFTDHEPELGALVSKGRRDEFKSFLAFGDAQSAATIPNPQDRPTFEKSKLRWSERDDHEHARVLSQVKALLRLRRDDPVLRARCDRRDLRARVDANALVVERAGEAGRRILVANWTSDTMHFDWQALGVPLFRTGELDGGTLAPFSAAVLAAPSPASAPPTVNTSDAQVRRP
ncbi:MAG: malto-oligosyltrehalose trehalohydrolase [Polyangiaceae bacterium]|jgi:maltooligosyltrehalose trehalohydrolase